MTRSAKCKPSKPDPVAAELSRLGAKVEVMGLAVRELQAELRAALRPMPVEPGDLVALNGDLVTITAAARLAGRSSETLRRWLDHDDLGQYDRATGRLMVSVRRLRSFMLCRFGVLPAGLQ